MCGICGSFSLSGARVDPAAVRAMLAELVHRGPDAEGLFEAPGIVAGIRRLAVIDVEGGGQPIANEDGSVRVVFNGEIYNFAELRTGLVARGHVFRTRSDTEVLVHLWEEHGPGLVDQLNGMFAFCIHDGRRGEIFLARDRIGIKPLFYATVGDRLLFASESRALLRGGGVSDEVDPSALLELFCLQFVTGERTVRRSIRELPPGHAMHWRRGELSIRRYWEIPTPEPRGSAAEEELVDELRGLLQSSISLRRVADVPLGTFLSGGIDSTIVTAELARQIDRPVVTFSVGFEGDAAFDEREYAREAADWLGTEHHELLLSSVEIADELPGLIEHLAEPVVDPALIPTYLLSRFAREKVTVVLSGEGADELFAGYRRYAYQERYGWLGKLPGARQAGRGALGGILPRRVEQAIGALSQSDPARGHVEWSSTLGAAMIDRLFEPEAVERFRERMAGHFAAYFPGTASRLAEQLRADQHEWLPHDLLAKVDRASMAVSLEARVPFLDHRIVEWAAGLPDDLRIEGKTTKRLLRTAFGHELPPRLVSRPKQGFDLPLAAWIRGPLRERVGDLLARDRLGAFDALRPDAVEAMVDKHLSGEQDFGLPLFNLVSVMIFLDGEA